LAIALPIDTGIGPASALTAYRLAADFLQQMFAVGAGKNVETSRRRALKIGEALRNDAVAKPETVARSITVTLDSTFIHSCQDGERRLVAAGRQC
jgi:hypothetical protein